MNSTLQLSLQLSAKTLFRSKNFLHLNPKSFFFLLIILSLLRQVFQKSSSRLIPRCLALILAVSVNHKTSSLSSSDLSTNSYYSTRVFFALDFLIPSNTVYQHHCIGKDIIMRMIVMIITVIILITNIIINHHTIIILIIIYRYDRAKFMLEIDSKMSESLSCGCRAPPTKGIIHHRHHHCHHHHHHNHRNIHTIATICEILKYATCSSIMCINICAEEIHTCKCCVKLFVNLSAIRSDVGSYQFNDLEYAFYISVSVDNIDILSF